MPALLITLTLVASAQGFNPDPERIAPRILVLYNANWPDADGDGLGDSEQVARAYIAKRRVPEQNLLAIDCSASGISYSGLAGWQACWDEIIVPLRAKLDLEYGENDIAGFVLCHGLPYLIVQPDERSLDEALIRLWLLGSRDAPPFGGVGVPNSWFDPSPTVYEDLSRFDPKDSKEAGTRTYLVARLDAPDAARSIELIDFALYGDAYLSPLPGYYGGNAYVDTRFGLYSDQQLANYPYGHFQYAGADKDMAYGRRWFEQAGFPLLWEPYETEIGEPGASFSDGSSAVLAPRCLWYSGWYNYLKYQDAWEWLVGSAGSDLDSLSIAFLREEQPASFLASAFRRGLTAGVGVIAEPYLNGHVYPETFTYYLVNRGFTFAEAARASDPKLLWRNLFVGDFLYQPMRAGKTPLIDKQPPPPAAVQVRPGATAHERVFQTRLDTRGHLPDVGRLSLHHGQTPAYGMLVTGEDDRPRLYHTARIGGLGGDQILHFRADYTDPAGNVGPGHDFILHTALASQPVLARVIAPDTVQLGQSFEVELVFGAQAGFASLTATSITVTAAVLGWYQRDVAPLILGLAPRYFRDPDGTLRSARFTVPGSLPADSYLIEVGAASSAGTDFHSAVVALQ